MSKRRHAAADGLERFLSAEQRASIRAPISEARTLPRAAFTSQDFFDLEVERIFRRNWMALCFAGALPQRGDVVPLELFGMPLLALRGDDAQVRVFHNVCPYDGCLVSLDPQERARELVVPYHGWRYDLRGRLRAIPYWDGNETPELRSEFLSHAVVRQHLVPLLAAHHGTHVGGWVFGDIVERREHAGINIEIFVIDQRTI